MNPNAATLRRRIGYIPTNPQFPGGMTPINYLDYMGRLFGLPLNVRKPRLAALIRAVDLLSHAGTDIAMLHNRDRVYHVAPRTHPSRGSGRNGTRIARVTSG